MDGNPGRSFRMGANHQDKRVLVGSWARKLLSLALRREGVMWDLAWCRECGRGLHVSLVNRVFRRRCAGRNERVRGLNAKSGTKWWFGRASTLGAVGCIESGDTHCGGERRLHRGPGETGGTVSLKGKEGGTWSSAGTIVSGIMHMGEMVYRDIVLARLLTNSIPYRRQRPGRMN